MKGIYFSNKFIQQIRKCNPTGKNTEEGGIILATIYSDYVIIEDITLPSKFDKKRKFSFLRNKRIHQETINNKWLESVKTLHYVGEWHTHPESKPNPSSIDKREMKKSYKKNRFVTSFLLQIIVGYEYFWVGYVEDNIDLQGLMYVKYNKVPYEIISTG